MEFSDAPDALKKARLTGLQHGHLELADRGWSPWCPLPRCHAGRIIMMAGADSQPVCLQSKPGRSRAPISGKSGVGAKHRPAPGPGPVPAAPVPESTRAGARRRARRPSPGLPVGPAEAAGLPPVLVAAECQRATTSLSVTIARPRRHGVSISGPLRLRRCASSSACVIASGQQLGNLPVDRRRAVTRDGRPPGRASLRLPT